MRYILILRVNEKTHLSFGEMVLLTIWRLIKKTYDIEYLLYWVFANDQRNIKSVHWNTSKHKSNTKNYACIYLTYEWQTLVTVYDWFDTFFAPIKVPITYGQVDPSHFPKGRHIFNDDCVDGCQFKLTKLNQQFLHICRQKLLWLCDYLTINEKCKKVFDVKPEKLILRIWNLIVDIENNKWK